MSSTTGSKRKRPGEPRLFFSGAVDELVDEAVKALIEGWLVPMLVEEYLRLKGQSRSPHDSGDTKPFWEARGLDE